MNKTTALKGGQRSEKSQTSHATFAFTDQTDPVLQFLTFFDSSTIITFREVVLKKISVKNYYDTQCYASDKQKQQPTFMTNPRTPKTTTNIHDEPGFVSGCQDQEIDAPWLTNYHRLKKYEAYTRHWLALSNLARPDHPLETSEKSLAAGRELLFLVNITEWFWRPEPAGLCPPPPYSVVRALRVCPEQIKNFAVLSEILF